jgi:hypothetical protein
MIRIRSATALGAWNGALRFHRSSPASTAFCSATPWCVEVGAQARHSVGEVAHVYR